MRKMILASMLITIMTVSVSFAATWTVASNTRADFSGIQDAIMDSDVQSGDTILVLPGVYEELVRVPSNKTLTIRSTEGFGETVIRRPKNPFNGPQMTVLIQSGSIFDGFSVENPYGIVEPPTTLDQIPDRSEFMENTAGITITGPAHVMNCHVSGHRFGFLQECPSGALGRNPSMRFNISVNNDIGICCCETFSTVRDNIVMNNHWVGILSSHSSCDDIINNLVVSNGTVDREYSCGILCWQSYDWRPYELNPRISVNTIANNIGDGIVCIWQLGASCQPVIENSIIASNSGVGIRVVPANDGINDPKPRVYKCNIWGNGNSETQNVTRLIDCISENPIFEEGFFLSSTSPCIDRGMIPDNIGSTSVDGMLDRMNTDLGFHNPASIATQKH